MLEIPLVNDGDSPVAIILAIAALIEAIAVLIQAIPVMMQGKTKQDK
jgi:predicted aconitase with swiveling domain